VLLKDLLEAAADQLELVMVSLSSDNVLLLFFVCLLNVKQLYSCGVVGFKYAKTFAHTSVGSWQTVSADLLEERVLLQKHKIPLADGRRFPRPCKEAFVATRL